MCLLRPDLLVLAPRGYAAALGYKPSTSPTIIRSNDTNFNDKLSCLQSCPLYGILRGLENFGRPVPIPGGEYVQPSYEFSYYLIAFRHLYGIDAELICRAYADGPSEWVSSTATFGDPNSNRYYVSREWQLELSRTFLG